MRDRAWAVSKATELVDEMTLEEMIDQLTYSAPAIPRLDVPSYNYWNEALHGVARSGTATVFPQAIAMAATFSPEILEKTASIISTEARAKYNGYKEEGDIDKYKGINFWSPNLNLFRDPRWGRGQETYGEDPFLIGRLGVAFINGLQGDGKIIKAAACAKHFAVHSGPEDLRHEFDAVVDDKELWETYLPAFEECVTEANVETVMGAYNRTNGEPCCGSDTLIKEILRGKWGFKGHFVSDCWAIRDFHEYHKVTKSKEESGTMALKAGCDLNCGCTYKHLMKAYQKKLISREDVRTAAINIFTTRYLLGMFEECEYDNISYEKLACKEHIDYSLEVAEKSVVLLKNDNILPLTKKVLEENNIKTIGIIGPNADSKKALQGNYYGTAPGYITVLDGVNNISEEYNFRVMYAVGSEIVINKSEPLSERDNDRLSEAIQVAKHSDVVILCLGLNEEYEGEEGDEGNSYASGDKKNLHLPNVQRRLLEEVCKANKNVIVVNMTGSAMYLDYADNNARAVMQGWYLGAEGGRAISNIIFGKVSPSGKLPVTFYSENNTMPEFTDYSMKNRTYRYMKEKPLYEFGYGLTYGDIAIEKSDILSEDESNIQISVEVSNKGLYDTDDVIQIYAKVEDSINAIPNYSLCGVKRIYLEVGSKHTCIVNVSKKYIQVVDNEGNRNFEGKVTLYVGNEGPKEDKINETFRYIKLYDN